MNNAAAKSTRNYQRQAVEWNASWDNPVGAGGEGQVRDVTPQGAFLHPTERAALVEVGTHLRLHISVPGETLELELWGTVRWKGLSHIHNCFGFGVQFVSRAPLSEPRR